jgi:hypothetical protein
MPPSAKAMARSTMPARPALRDADALAGLSPIKAAGGGRRGTGLLVRQSASPAVASTRSGKDPRLRMAEGAQGGRPQLGVHPWHVAQIDRFVSDVIAAQT